MQDSAFGRRAEHEWLVIGTGAMGCLWACSLIAAGYLVRIRGRIPGASVAQKWLRLSTENGEQNFAARLEGSRESSLLRYVLVCTKADAVESALVGIRPRIAPDAAVVLLQNGMGLHDVAARTLPKARIFAAVTTEGAWQDAPFSVRHAGRGKTLVGRWPEGDGAEVVVAALNGGPLEVQACNTIAAELWRKLAVNCAINPLTALHGCVNGELLENPSLKREFDALCAEIATILAGIGHASTAAEVAESATSVARATAANRSSMLQDLDAGRRTEIDWITGYLCGAARRAGIDAPMNESLLSALHAREPR